MKEIRKSLRGPWSDVFAQLRIMVAEVLAAWPVAAVEIILAKAEVTPEEGARDIRPWKEALTECGVTIRIGYGQTAPGHQVVVRR